VMLCIDPSGGYAAATPGEIREAMSARIIRLP
jgi:hypothetical protein